MKKSLLIAGSLTIVAVVLAALYFTTLALNDSEGNPEVAARVNGERILKSDIDKELGTLPPDMNLSRLQVLDFLIEKKLLLQEAQKRDIEATEDEIDTLLLGYDAPAASLSASEIRQRLREQILISKLLDSVVLDQLAIRNDDVQQIYETAYRPRNISFEDAEPEIVKFLIARNKENVRNSYINNLKVNADLTIFQNY